MDHKRGLVKKIASLETQNFDFWQRIVF